ncbi:MAG: hypothetical protein R8M45_02280 [Ghiorsea sp.]
MIHPTDAEMNDIFSEEQFKQFFNEACTQGKNHQCFVAYVVHFPETREFLAEHEITDEHELNMFSLIPDFAIKYDDYKSAFIVALTFDRPVEVQLLFDIKGKHFCLPMSENNE